MLRIQTRGSNVLSIAGSTIKVSQCIFNNALFHVDFLVSHDVFELDYASATDKVYIVSDDGFSKQLTRVGNYFRLTMGATDFNMVGVSPGTTTTKVCRISYERDDAGSPLTFSSDLSESFNLSIHRQYTWTPHIIGGCIHWLDVFDLGADASNIEEYADKSDVGSDLVDGSVAPVVDTFFNGIKGMLFAGSANEELVSTYNQFGVSSAASVAGVAMLKVVDGTERSIIKVGGTNGLEVVFDNAAVTAQSNTDQADSASAIPVNTPFVFIATYNETNVTININLLTQVSTAATGTYNSGILHYNHETTDKGNFVLGDVMVFNDVLSTAEINKVAKALMAKFNVSA